MKKLIFVLSVFLLSSCMTIKPGGVNSGKKYFETFYVGEKGTMYFIKPMLFVGEGDDELKVDFTFNYKTEIIDSVSIKFSIYDQSIYKYLDSLKIENSQYSLSLGAPNFLFNERKKENFQSRFDINTPLQNLPQLFSDKDWQISLYYKGETIAFHPHKKTQEIIETLDYNVFVLMQ